MLVLTGLKLTPLIFKITMICFLQSLASLPASVSISNRVSSYCVNHRADLDTWARYLSSSLLDCAFKCFPIRLKSSILGNLLDGKVMQLDLRNVLVFGTKFVKSLVLGVLFQIKKNAKSRYKYEVRRLKRRQDVLLAQLFSRRDKSRLWSEIHQLKHAYPRSPPCVDGVSGDKNISNLFASKFQNVLNANSGPVFSPLVTDSLLGDVHFSDDDVLQAILQLKPHKFDLCWICAEQLKVCLLHYLSAPFCIFNFYSS